MARILLCVDDAMLETALLCHGHTLRRASLPKGGLAVMALWQFRRAVAGFRPDFLLAAAGDANAADTARQLGTRLAEPPADAAFLADHWLSAPFVATPPRPTILYGGGLVPLTIEGADRAVLTGPAMPPLPPEIAALGTATPDLVAGLMGAGAVVVVAEAPGMRNLVADGITGHLFPPGDLASLTMLLRGLVEAPERRRKMALAARAAFLTRHKAAHADIVRTFGA